ncbi:MAG TPA: radical SAM protein, partial [Ktedonobacterales bacterium]|nr:radical SAM protein [Ktedonobacterales bacterium]
MGERDVRLTEPIPVVTAARPAQDRPALAVHELRPKTVLNRMRPFGSDGTGRPATAWSINPYRGCQHACAYCYARRTHADFDMNGGQEFEREIFVKVGAAQVLREQLWRRRCSTWNTPIVIGSAVDPYQPLEGQRRITRSILEVIRDARAPVQIITKNSMVIRDADILAEIARRANCAVLISITTLDADLARVMEPATPPPLKRLAAIKTLVERGVPAGVMVAPILPWITDAPGALEDLALAAKRSNTQWLCAGTLRLHPDVRPWFFEWLERERPDLLARYQRWYQYTEAPREYRRRLHDRMAMIRATLGLPSGPPEIVDPRPEQLTLF